MQRTIILINLVLFILLLEAGTRLGGLEYIESINVGTIEGQKRLDLEFLTSEEELVTGAKLKIPHPFFGFGKPGETENLRFETDQNYKTVNDEKNVLAIFGGSVANNAYRLTELKNPKYASKALDLPVSNVVNFAAGGHRQPQQLNISNVYAHAYNIAISIEGRNEMTRNHRYFPPYFPHQSAAASVFFGQAENLAEIGELNLLFAKYEKAKKNFRENAKGPFQYLSTIYAVQKKLIARQIIVKANEMTELRGRSAFLDKESYTSAAMLKRWLRYSCQQQNLQTSFGIKSFFVIQPKPQHLKQLSQTELNIVLKDQFDERKQMYQPVIDLKVEAIRESGLELIDLTGIFEDEKETVYSDSCCHFTDKSRPKFVSFVLKRVKEILQKKAYHPKKCDIQKLTMELQKQFPTKNVW